MRFLDFHLGLEVHLHQCFDLQRSLARTRVKVINSYGKFHTPDSNIPLSLFGCRTDQVECVLFHPCLLVKAEHLSRFKHRTYINTLGLGISTITLLIIHGNPLSGLTCNMA